MKTKKRFENFLEIYSKRNLYEKHTINNILRVPLFYMQYEKSLYYTCSTTTLIILIIFNNCPKFKLNHSNLCKF
jgi:hypothetical protein